MDLNLIQARLAPSAAMESTNIRRAAVLLGLMNLDRGPEIVFTQRSLQVQLHKGEISLPGGMVEPYDTDATETALREAEEEIGLSPTNVRPLGFLEGLSTITGIWVDPLVGEIESPFDFRIDPREVARAFTLSLEQLRAPGVRRVEPRAHNDVVYQDIQFHVGDVVVWGATGRMVDRFLQCLC